MDTKSKTTVLVGGCFDILHFGHIEFLHKAQELGTYLIVLLEADSRIKDLKGDTRPFHTQLMRKRMLESLRYVDEVISLPDNMTHEKYAHKVKDIHPDIIAITTGDPICERKSELATIVGATLVVIPRFESPTTSQIAHILELE